MTFIRNTFLAAILTVGLVGAAHAVTFKEIAGKWCGLTTSYQFNHDLLIVTFLDRSPTKRFKVTSYEYSADKMTMHWLNEGKELFTEFGEFSADGRTMAQVKSEVGPRRPFHRC